MNFKKIGMFVFLSPLYLLLLAIATAFIAAIGYALFEIFKFVFLSSWLNFFLSCAIIWASALFSYLVYESN